MTWQELIESVPRGLEKSAGKWRMFSQSEMTMHIHKIYVRTYLRRYSGILCNRLSFMALIPASSLLLASLISLLGSGFLSSTNAIASAVPVGGGEGPPGGPLGMSIGIAGLPISILCAMASAAAAAAAATAAAAAAGPVSRSFHLFLSKSSGAVVGAVPKTATRRHRRKKGCSRGRNRKPRARSICKSTGFLYSSVPIKTHMRFLLFRINFRDAF